MISYRKGGILTEKDGKSVEKSRMQELDDFWDLGAMLPEKKPGRVFSRDVETVELSLGGEDAPEFKIPKRSERQNAALEALKKAEEKVGVTPVVPSAPQRTVISAADLEYEKLEERRGEMMKKQEASPDAPPKPETYLPDNPLLESVTLLPSRSRYSFFELFRGQAERFHKRKGRECPAVPFFSYAPQYQQLSPAQRKYYLWFRDCAREGKYIPADMPYVLLYVCEILNLPDLIPPEKGILLLCGLWKAYRKPYEHLLEMRMIEWVCDYCLLYRLAPPYELLSDFYPEIVRKAQFKEFWLGYDKSTDSPIASAALAYGSNYRYQSGKFLTDSNRKMFDTHMKNAFRAAFGVLSLDDAEVIGICSRRAVALNVSRESFSGAYVYSGVNRRIEVKALMLTRSAEFRMMVTDLEKYIENQIRALLAVKSRFHTHALDKKMKAAVDAYFAPFFEKEKAAKKAAAAPSVPPVPEYERYYEPVSTGFSLSDAERIERNSRATAILLTEGNDEYAPDPQDKAEMPEEKTEKAEKAEETTDAISEGLVALLGGNRTEFERIAAREHLLPDSLAEQINDAALDFLGDIALEEAEDGYRVIEDYQEDIAEWLKQKKSKSPSGF